MHAHNSMKLEFVQEKKKKKVSRNFFTTFENYMDYCPETVRNIAKLFVFRKGSTLGIVSVSDQ